MEPDIIEKLVFFVMYVHLFCQVVHVCPILLFYKTEIKNSSSVCEIKKKKKKIDSLHGKSEKLFNRRGWGKTFND